MLRALVIALTALAFLAGPAMANQCPLLIKQLNDAVAKMKADDPKVKQAKELIAEAQKLHDTGKHADSVEKAEDADGNPLLPERFRLSGWREPA